MGSNDIVQKTDPSLQRKQRFCNRYNSLDNIGRDNNPQDSCNSNRPGNRMSCHNTRIRYSPVGKYRNNPVQKLIRQKL